MSKRNQSKARPSASASVPGKAAATTTDTGGINLDLVRELARIAGEFNLSEIEADPSGHVRVQRQVAGAASDVRPMLMPGLSLAPPPVAVAPEGAAEPGMMVTSPFVGTFYRAPSPEAVSFVEVGQLVRKGQVVCIVEAMKLMNEIEAEADGRVAEILAENGQHVEYGQPLIRLTKS
jgi:acetyl-CoA carboxylase biotin carboxyl carrier protein